MNSIKRLWDIQELEMKQRKMEKLLEQSDIALELRKVKLDIESAQREFKALKDSYNKLKLEMEQTEFQVSELKKQITTLDKKLFDGTLVNKKEIAGAQHRLTALKEQVNQTENKELEILEEQELLKNKLLIINESLKEQKEEFYQLRERYFKNKQKTQDELNQLFQEKDQLSKEIDSELLTLFYEMQKQLKKPVAKVENGICNGCHMVVTFDKLKKLKGSDLVKCDNCGRMIFSEYAN